MYKCPFPGCEYVAANAILNSHAKTHGYKTTTLMSAEHGGPKLLNYDNKKYSKVTSATNSITTGSFNNIDALLNHKRRK